MNKVITLCSVVIISIFFSSAVLSGVESLRGKTALDAAATKAKKHKLNVEEGGYERSFKEQPPLVPHQVEKYRVTLKNNGCLKCHSEKAHKKENAPKVGDSHYIDRNGKTLKKISMRRYFCSQCHVPQLKSDPLVENTFEGVQ